MTLRAVLFIPALVLAAADEAPAQGDPRRIVDEILSEDDYRRDGNFDEESSGSGRSGEIAEPEEIPREFDEFGHLSGLFDFVLWGVVIVFVGFILYWIGTAMAGRTQRPPRDDAKASGVKARRRHRATDAPVGEVTPPSWTDVDAAASRREFDEAVHLMLAIALHAISARTPLHPSETSREVLDTAELGRARAPLKTLVDAVERSHFGARDTDETLYLECRESCKALSGAGADG